MLPGKKYTPEDFLRIAWRRKWFILVPAAVIAAGTFVYARWLPNRYSSAATVLVVPQRVPESYVQSTVSADVAERLQTISQTILSRTKLERIIEEFNLYAEDRKTMIMEDIVERMRRTDIKINVATPRNRNEDATHFSVAFESSQPRTSMLVAERLANMFMQENLVDREALADSTSQFLQSEVEDARRQLLEHEAKFEAFRQRNAGRLPTQVQSNLQMLQVTQGQIQANIDAANRERDRLTVLEGTLAEMIEAAGRGSAAPATATTAGAPAATFAQQLEAARFALRGLELRQKADHPNIQSAKRVIAELEAKAAAEAAEAAEALADATVKEEQQRIVQLPPAAAENANRMRLEAQQLRRSLETRKAEDERLRKVMGSYTFSLEAAPKLESELTELMRDYGILQTQYESLKKKSEDSQLAVNLERRQIGEQFKMIDGARLPERPISPNRTRINFMGLLAGLGFGVALVALLEYRDTTLKTDDDVVTSLALPVIAVIPAMVTAGDRKRQRRRRLLLAAGASAVTIVAVAAVVAWRLELIQRWIR